jgi:uncharacterized membrane protein YjgN (DUF898 family)
MTPSASNASGLRSSSRSPYRGPTQVDSSRTQGVVQVMGRTTTGAGDLTPSLRRPNDAYQIPIRFTGRGGAYFRIWIVNLLLTALTLSLYRPWARARTLRYFYSHTRVSSHPLDFHGDPWKMLRGHVLMGLLLLGYAVGGDVSPLAGAIGAAALVVLWPALFRASMQFRMANTSWRGMRFGFVGSLRGAYVYFSVPVLLVVLVGAVAAAVPRPQAPVAALTGGVLLVALVPWFYWLLKRYQHDHYTYAQHKAELRASAGSVYGVFIRTALIALLAAVVAGAVVGGVGAALGATLWALLPGKAPDQGSPMPDGAMVGLVAGVVLLVLLVMGVAQMLVRAHFTAQMQNLVWSRTGSRVFRFKSDMQVGLLMRLMLKNVVLTVLTLGLYYPFAKIELVRMRLESMMLVSRASLDDLVNFRQGRAGDAAGDAAGDLLGADFGL